MENTAEGKFKKTIDDEEFMHALRNDPLGFFEQWPIHKIRVECLGEIRRHVSYSRYGISEDWSAWVEECISVLVEHRDALAGEMLEWYICEATKGEAAAKAIEFAIGLKALRSPTTNLSKFIAGRLLKEQGWGRHWHLIPSLRGYLSELLEKIGRASRSYGYFPYQWIEAERALKIIMAAQDCFFLPQIEELIALHQNGIVKPSVNEPHYVKDVNVAMLKATRRLLLKAKKEYLANQ